MKQLKQIVLPTLSLFIISLVMTGLILIVNEFTAERIQNLMYANLIAAKQEIFGDIGFTREVVTIDGDEVSYYVMDDDYGYIFVTTVIGYGGDMTVVIGIDTDGVVTGVEVTEHEETPGLGTRVFDYEFVSRFKISYSPQGFIVGYNIDSITGSTITVDALIVAVNNALDIYREVR